MFVPPSTYYIYIYVAGSIKLVYFTNPRMVDFYGPYIDAFSKEASP